MIEIIENEDGLCNIEEKAAVGGYYNDDYADMAATIRALWKAVTINRAYEMRQSELAVMKSGTHESILPCQKP